MPFRYRLQKVLDFRIRKKEAQLLEVQKAQQAVYEAEENIRQNEAEIQQTIINKRTADFRMMEYYDKYLHHLWDKADVLEQERQRVQAILDEEKEKLVKCEQEVKVVEKHKEKQKEAYLEEEKAQELKQFSEIGVQRFFIQSRETEEELAMEEELKKLESQ
jgi:flagellar FliJ protein